MKQTKKELFWELFRFLLVGGTATAVDYLIFGLFDALIFPAVFPNSAIWQTVALVMATAFGFCVGLVVNWILSVKFVFRAVKNREEASSKKSFLLFALIGVVGLILTEVGVVSLVSVFPSFSLFGSIEFLGTLWEKWLAKMIMTALVLVWNYTGRKVFIFKS